MSVVVRKSCVSSRNIEDNERLSFPSPHALSPHARFGSVRDFTPALAGSVTAGTQTYSVRLGRLTKNDRSVAASFCIGLSAKDAATSGNLRITGLPYTCGPNLAYATVLCYVRNFDIDTAGGFTHVEGILGPGDTFIQLYESGDNVVPVTLTEADFGATSYIYGTIVYNT